MLYYIQQFLMSLGLSPGRGGFILHAIEKILAKASNNSSVETGQIVNVKVDFAEINDLYLQTIISFEEMGGKRVWDKDKLAFVFDHYAPSPTIQASANHKAMREFAKTQELTRHFDIDAGVCHQVMVEAGVVLPGRVIVATDSHTTTHGALGAFGTGVGATDMAVIMITGEMWMRVPEIINIKIDGQASKGVLPKDVVLYALGLIKADGAVYKAVEFSGSYVEHLGVSGRMVLCNMAVEMGAKAAYIQPNDDVIAYANEHMAYPYEVQYTDEGFVYDAEYYYDISALSPQVAAPHSVDNVKPIEDVCGIPLDQGFIGSCTGGRTEDFAVAAEILKGHKIPRYSRLVIIPASAEVMRECIDKGYIQTLMDAGATISSPGCGPCLGAHEGIIAAGERCISSTNRNFPGRMGSTGGEIYLASPATVAASMLTGKITDPRTINLEV